MLWFAGFFNYADRQGVFSVFPLIGREFDLSKTQLGYLGSAFMIVYAASSPFSGYTVDLLPRRLLITLGLTFWSLICAATALSRSYYQLLFFRAAEGLGESIYFPASISLLSDYHGPRTRSRALSIHQTSVYLGTAGGAVLAGYLGERHGWRSSFWVLGLAGMVYAGLLGFGLVEPVRESNRDRFAGSQNGKGPSRIIERSAFRRPVPVRWSARLGRILTNPAAVLLLMVFVAANFVAGTFLAWLPFCTSIVAILIWGSRAPRDSRPRFFIGRSRVCRGRLLGGVAGRLGNVLGRVGAGSRVQSAGLIVAVPFVFLTGWSTSVPVLIAALIGAGVCKGDL